MIVHSNNDLLRRGDQKFLVLLLSFAFVYFTGTTVWSSRTKEPETVRQSATDGPKFQVDLNTADEAELLLLPGIGTTLARRILDYRTEHGPFRKNEEITHITGIGPKKSAKILPMLKEISSQ